MRNRVLEGGEKGNWGSYRSAALRLASSTFGAKIAFMLAISCSFSIFYD